MIDAAGIRWSIGSLENLYPKFHEEEIRSNEPRIEARFTEQVVKSDHGSHTAVTSL
jgi:hypothetical protein